MELIVTVLLISMAMITAYEAGRFDGKRGL